MRRYVFLIERTGHSADRFFTFFRGHNESERLSAITSRGRIGDNTVAASSFKRTIRRKFIPEANRTASSTFPGLWLFREELLTSSDLPPGQAPAAPKVIRKNPLVQLVPLRHHEAILFHAPSPDERVCYILVRRKTRFDQLLERLSNSTLDAPEGRRYLPLSKAVGDASWKAKLSFSRKLERLNDSVQTRLAWIEVCNTRWRHLRFQARRMKSGRATRRIVLLEKGVELTLGEGHISFCIKPDTTTSSQSSAKAESNISDVSSHPSSSNVDAVPAAT